MWLVAWEIDGVTVYCGPFETKEEAQVELAKRVFQDSKEYRVEFDPYF